MVSNEKKSGHVKDEKNRIAELEAEVKRLNKDIDQHASRLEWATELLTACYPAARHHYKQSAFGYALDGTHERYLKSDEKECVNNYQAYEELKKFLDLD